VREALPSAGVALWKAITLPECTPTLEAELLIKAYSIPPAISVNQYSFLSLVFFLKDA